ncbi:hypothetical protein [Hoylesella loescheii]|jgi:hypothetical protein|uniref:hypothetical protein n=1 Tax=Hoylesella loescheii TaxID=840 RepID=UPI00248DD845|nr:hypothetical protein [Hoylesella loescheii]
MRILVFIALAALTMVACVAPKPKEKGVATTKRTKEQAPEATPTMKDSTPTQRPVVPDTTTKYIEEDGGMTQIESKFFTETSSMQAIYQETIRRGNIDNAEMLLPKLPSKNKEVNVDKNGLIGISYKIGHRQATVEMYYNGGVTTLILREQSRGVKREIIHSAD